MTAVILLIIGAITFGLCFLIDWLIKRIKQRKKGTHESHTVRQPTRAIGIGIVLTVAGLALALFWGQALGLWGGLVIFLLGVVLIGSYFVFYINYDEESFTYCTIKGKKRYLYNQIRGEQVIATRSGINVILYMGGSTVEMSEGMQGVREFLSHAYYARCRQLNIDPAENPPPAPRELLWFPEPSEY